jgi:hypothetical protein
LASLCGIMVLDLVTGKISPKLLNFWGNHDKILEGLGKIKQDFCMQSFMESWQDIFLKVFFGKIVQDFSLQDFWKDLVESWRDLGGFWVRSSRISACKALWNHDKIFLKVFFGKIVQDFARFFFARFLERSCGITTRSWRILGKILQDFCMQSFMESWQDLHEGIIWSCWIFGKIWWWDHGKTLHDFWCLV